MQVQVVQQLELLHSFLLKTFYRIKDNYCSWKLTMKLPSVSHKMFNHFRLGTNIVTGQIQKPKPLGCMIMSKNLT